MVKPLALAATVIRLPLNAAVAVTSVAVTIPPVSWASDLTQDVLHRSIDILMRVVARLTKGPAEESIHLKGIFVPQPNQATVLNAPVTGTIPTELEGMFVNVNPNPQYLPIGGYHLFEGDGSLTSVRIHKDGRASFAYTHFNTEKRRYEKALGRSNELSLMAMRGYSGLALVFLSAMKRHLARKKYSRSTANTNIDEHGGRLYALWEGGLPHQLGITSDGAALQIKGQLKYEEYEGPFSAHPCAHPTNGNWYSVSYMLENPNKDAEIVVLDAKSQFVRSIPLHLGRKPMIHDAAITEKYLVVLDLPVLLTPEDMLKADGGVIRSHADKPGRIGLFPVDAVNEKSIIWFEVPSCASFHKVNAYDTEEGVVLHICQFPHFNLMTLNEIMDSQLVRYDMNVTKGTVDWRVEQLGLNETFGKGAYVEFPIVNRKLVGRKAKYGFASIVASPDDKTDNRIMGVCKYDLEMGQTVGAIKFEGYGLGEAGLVDKKNAVNEDDGYIAQFVRNNDGNVVMNVYDAVTMCETPIATVHAPVGFHVPSGFHSQFIDEQTLSRLK